MHADTEEGEDGTVDGPVPPVDGEADGRLIAQGGNRDRKWQQAKSLNKRRMKEGPCSLPAPQVPTWGETWLHCYSHTS